MIAAVDFESFYHKNRVSVKIQGTYGYMNHPEFDPYLVAIVTDSGEQFVGHPEEFDWATLEGATILSHNASFDEALYRHLRDKGVIDAFTPAVWHCTGDMCGYLGAPRSLAKACEMLLGIPVSKDTRDAMNGKQWADMTEEFRQEVLLYATGDSVLCLQLWQAFSDRWPEDERELSRMTREMGWYGVCVDKEGLQEDSQRLVVLREDLATMLPWVGRPDDEPPPQAGKKKKAKPVGTSPLSSKALQSYVLSTGAQLPIVTKMEKGEKKVSVSFSKTEDAVIRWVEQNPGPGEVVRLLWKYRSANTLYRKFEAMIARVRPDTKRMNYSLIYCGAHTLRDAGGGGGVNMQNLPRGAMLADAFKLAYGGFGGSDDDDDVYDTDGEEFGVSLRSRIIAAPGKVLLAGDLAAIEPRCLTFMAGDFATLELARNAPDSDWYDARARAWGLYRNPLPLKKGDPDLRAVVKQLEIGLGYGMGIDVYGKKTGLSYDEAARNHANYQRWNPKVVEFWARLEQGLRASVGTSFDVILPSGRMVRFKGVAYERGKLSFLRLTHAGYVRQPIHPGFATENLVQALARDIYMDRVLAAARAGFHIVMRVHDEIVCEVDEDKAEQEKPRLRQIMSTSPSWLPQLPLAAGVEFGKTYADAK